MSPASGKSDLGMKTALNRIFHDTGWHFSRFSRLHPRFCYKMQREPADSNHYAASPQNKGRKSLADYFTRRHDISTRIQDVADDNITYVYLALCYRRVNFPHAIKHQLLWYGGGGFYSHKPSALNSDGGGDGALRVSSFVLCVYG